MILHLWLFEGSKERFGFLPWLNFLMPLKPFNRLPAGGDGDYHRE